MEFCRTNKTLAEWMNKYDPFFNVNFQDGWAHTHTLTVFQCDWIESEELCE